MLTPTAFLCFLLFGIGVSLELDKDRNDLLNEISVDNKIITEDVIKKIYNDFKSEQDRKDAAILSEGMKVRAGDFLEEKIDPVKTPKYRDDTKLELESRKLKLGDLEALKEEINDEANHRMVVAKPILDVPEPGIYKKSLADEKNEDQNLFEIVGSSIVNSVRFVWHELKKIYNWWWEGGWY